MIPCRFCIGLYLLYHNKLLELQSHVAPRDKYCVLTLDTHPIMATSTNQLFIHKGGFLGSLARSLWRYKVHYRRLSKADISFFQASG